MNILFEDEHIIVINKPTGVATQTASIGQKDIYSEALKYRKRKKEPAEIYIVHRLDQPVSGIMILAKTKEVASELSQGVNSDFSKDYEAIVYGDVKPKSARLTDYLLKDNKNNLSRVVDKATKDGKKSVLSYEFVDKCLNEDASLLKIHLETGRHHQIRVQLSNAGFPIIGDRKYGNEKSIELADANKINRVCLCAVSNEFTHPITKEKMSFRIENDFNI